MTLYAAAQTLREAVTVLDEPFHRETIASELLRIADLIEREQLAHQETRGTVAALRQKYAHLTRIHAQCGKLLDALHEVEHFADEELGFMETVREAIAEAEKIT